MKTIKTLAIAFLFAHNAGWAVDMSAIQKVYSTTLNKINIDPKSPLAQFSIQYGTINLNLSAGIIHLSLQPNLKCPQGQFCATVMPAPIDISLSITDIETDECGSVHYVADPMLASPALMNVKKILESVEVIDNTSNTCPTLLPLSETQVRYVTINGREESLSTFDGKKLNLGEKKGIRTMGVEFQ